MPITRVRTPDGRIVRVKHPEGASKEEVIAFAQANHSAKNKFDPTGSGLDNLLAGVGKSFSETGAGIKQVGASVGNTLGLVSDDTVARLKAEERDRRERDAPLMDTMGGKLGLLGGYVAQGAVLPVGGLSAAAGRAGLTGAARVLANPAIEAGIYGAAQSALAPTVQGESRARNVALGGLAGTGSTLAMQGAGRLLSAPGRMADDAMRGASTGEYAQAVGLLDNAGIPLSSGQRSGANWLKQTESTLADIPWGGKPLQTLQEGQKRAYQKHLLKLAGLDDGSDMITAKTLEKLDDTLGRKYAQAFQGVEIDLTSPQFIDELAAIEARHSQMLPFEQRAKIRQIIDQLLDVGASQENGAKLLSGEEYQRIRSHIGKLAKNTANSDGYVSGLYADLKRLLDGAFEEVAGPEKFNTDAQYAAMKQLRKIYEGNGGPAMSEGFISPVQVARLASQNAGSKEWKEFARASAAVLPDRLGNSGTAQRNMVLGLLGGGTAGLAMVDPASLIYGPLMTRAFSKGAAKGVYPNVAGMIPQVTVSPLLQRQLLGGGRGLSQGLLAAERNP